MNTRYILWKAYFSNALYGALCKVGYGILAITAFQSPAFALPIGGQVNGGQASISQSGNTLSINQSSNRAIIDWSSFNIGSDESVHFYQPSASSLALNRVHRNDPSQIFGQLTANGKVVLVNPNGVFFGPNSKVDVSGLIASTANISNSDFMAGNMKFSQPGNANAAIVNQGTITAKEAGLVGFIAPNVENDGVITAKLGKVTLASGDTATLDMAGDNLITVAVSGNLPGQTVTNTGTIAADGGTVTLTAAAARNIVDSLVSNSGIIQANAVGQQGGTVILYAEGSNAVKGNVTANKGKKAGSSLVVNSGTITASGYDSGQKGGKITITGDNVGILSGSFIDASGDIGGGTIKIGGDFHGGGSTPTALNTYVDANSLIMANANISGNGGNVTVWSDGNTWFGGNILAEGGKNSGNGGFVETSGKQTLSMQGIVDASAPKGTAGTWLMDPNNLVINGIATSNAGSTPNWTAASGGGNVLNTDIDAALNGGTSVELTASGSITFASNISKSSGGDATLTAAAGTDIIVNSNIGSTVGKLNVVFDSDTASGGGAIFMNTGSSITSNGGNITLGGGALSGGLPTGAAVGDAYSNIGIISGQLQAGGGNISLSGDGYTNTDNPYVVGVYIYTKVQTTGSGTISITGVGGSNLAEPDTYFDHGVELYGALVSTANGNITIHGTAPLYFGLLIQGGGEVQSTGTGNITLYGNTMGVGEGAYLAGGSTVSTNSGNITITGIGANYNGGPNIGIILDGWGGGSPGTVESMSGNITMNGTGGSATGTANWGIYSGGGTIETGGAGTISLNGTGGTGGSADYGVYLGSGTTVHTLNGALTITGIGGETNMAGIYTTGGSNVIGGGSETGNITLTADKVSLANLSVQTTGNITAKEYTANTTIDIGTNAVGSLNWTDAELGFLNGGSYTFGDSSAGNLDINTAVTFANPVTFQSGGNITLDHALVSSASGNAITLASGENVINDVGASPLTPGTGRYLIYSTNPANNTLDGLSDAGDHVFNKTYGGYAPGSVTQPGNLFLYSLSPTITVTANNASRLYGAGDPSFTASYSGFIDNDTSSILSGSPSLTTPGGDTATSAAGSTYTITAAVGSLAQSLGYQFSYAPGTLTVNKAHLTVTADNQSRLYGAADPSFTDTISGFANGQNLGTSGVSGSASNTTPGGDTSASAAGSTYAITPTLGTLAASNYDFTTFTAGTLTVGNSTLPSQVEAVIDLRTPIGELRELSSSGYMASPLLVAAPIYIEAGLFNSLGLNESDAYHWWAGVVPTTMQSQP